MALSRNPGVLLRAQHRRTVLADNQSQSVAVNPFAIDQMPNDLVGCPLACEWARAQYRRRILANDPGQRRRGFRQHVEGVLVAEQAKEVCPIGFRIDHVTSSVIHDRETPDQDSSSAATSESRWSRAERDARPLRVDRGVRREPPPGWGGGAAA